jgi:hypothetical protein
MAFWPNIGLAPTRGNVPELIRPDPLGNEKNDDLVFLHLLPSLVLYRLGPETQNVVREKGPAAQHTLHNHPPGDGSN